MFLWCDFFPSKWDGVRDARVNDYNNQPQNLIWARRDKIVPQNCVRGISWFSQRTGDYRGIEIS